MLRYERSCPEPREVQERIQLAAAAKRARKRQARIRHAELTALGREVVRAAIAIREEQRRRATQWVSLAPFMDAAERFNARRRQP